MEMINGCNHMSYVEEFIARAEKARSRIREITPMELGNAMPQPIIIDVREKDEFERGHLEGAKLTAKECWKSRSLK
jgi:rhodanese-like protein